MRYLFSKNRIVDHIIYDVLSIIIGMIVWGFAEYDFYLPVPRTDFYTSTSQFKDILGGAIVSVIMAELSIQYCKLLSKWFWRQKHRVLMPIILIILVVLLNGLTTVVLTMIEYWVSPYDSNFIDNVSFSYFVSVSILSTAYLFIFIMNRYNEEKNLSIQSRLEAMSIHNDNHFVFNSLATLDGLITSDPNAAEAFISTFSQMYRQLVLNSKSTIIPLSDEIKFVRNYAELLSFRYSFLKIDIDNDLDYENTCFVFPSSIQHLVQNAVKHNRHGSGEVLNVKIYREDSYLIVENNLLPLVSDVSGGKTGLSSLEDRYRLICGKQGVDVEKDESSFKVRVLLLTKNSVRL